MIERDFERRARMQRRACGVTFGRYAFWLWAAWVVLGAIAWVFTLFGAASK